MTMLEADGVMRVRGAGASLHRPLPEEKAAPLRRNAEKHRIAPETARSGKSGGTAP